MGLGPGPGAGPGCCVCATGGAGGGVPLPAQPSPPMLLFFNKIRVDGTGLRAFLRGPLGSGPGRAALRDTLGSSSRGGGALPCAGSPGRGLYRRLECLSTCLTPPWSRCGTQVASIRPTWEKQWAPVSVGEGG